MFFSGLSYSYAQDTIYFINGTVAHCKVLSIVRNEINYMNNDTKVDVTVKKNEVGLIVYPNGYKEKYNFNRLRGGLKILYPVNSDFKNTISIDFFEIAFKNVSFSYERFFNQGRFGIKIPISFGFGSRPNPNYYSHKAEVNIDYLYNRIWGAGLEFNFYPLRQSKYNYYLGIEGNVGAFNYFTNYSTLYYGPSGNLLNNWTTEKHQGNHYSGTIHLGGVISLSDRLFIGGKVGAGFKAETTVFSDFSKVRGKLAIYLGFRF